MSSSSTLPTYPYRQGATATFSGPLDPFLHGGSSAAAAATPQYTPLSPATENLAAPSPHVAAHRQMPPPPSIGMAPPAGVGYATPCARSASAMAFSPQVPSWQSLPSLAPNATALFPTTLLAPPPTTVRPASAPSLSAPVQRGRRPRQPGWRPVAVLDSGFSPVQPAPAPAPSQPVQPPPSLSVATTSAPSGLSPADLPALLASRVAWLDPVVAIPALASSMGFPLSSMPALLSSAEPPLDAILGELVRLAFRAPAQSPSARQFLM